MQAKFALSRQSQLVRSVLLGSGSSLGFGVTCDLGTNLLTSWPSVDLSELGRIELWCLQDLDLADEDILEWVDSLAGLHDVLANELWHELIDSLDQLTRRDLFGHDVSHLLANGTDLGRLCVGSLADLEWALLGEANAEASQDISVNGLHINICLDQRLPLADKGTQLVSGEVHAPEVAQAGLALDILDTKTHLAEVIGLILVQVAKGNLEHTPLELLGGDLCALAACDKSLAAHWVAEHGWGLDVIPLLKCEGVHDLLLASFLSFCETLVLTDSHVRDFLLLLHMYNKSEIRADNAIRLH